MRITKETLQVIFDAALTLMTIVLAIVAIKQADVSRKAVRCATQANKAAGRAANAAEIAANAASIQAATSQKELELSERPCVLASHDIERPLTFLGTAVSFSSCDGLCRIAGYLPPPTLVGGPI
jgi:hypothetical protein